LPQVPRRTNLLQSGQPSAIGAIWVIAAAVFAAVLVASRAVRVEVSGTCRRDRAGLATNASDLEG